MQRNIIEMRQVADVDRGGGEDLLTSYTYEPLYNRISSTTDPRGNSDTFVPPLGSASKDRYTTSYFYDYQESNEPVEIAELFDIDLSSVPRGLGDLNGDGRTDQVVGNLVRAQAPSVLLRAESNQASVLGSTVQEIIGEYQWNEYGQALADIDQEGNVTEYHYYPENDPDGDGEKTFSVYKVLGNQPNGYLAEVVSDARDSPRRTSTVDPLAVRQQLFYDEVGNITSTLGARGILSVFEFNQLNEVVTMTAGADVSVAVANQELITGESPFAYRVVY